MKQIIKLKWPIVIIWILLVGSLLFLMPNLGELVREKGQVGVPEGYSSMQADKLLKELDNKTDKDNMNVIVAFHEEKELNSEQLKEVEKGIHELESKEKELGITSIISHLNNEELKEQLISKDGTTILTLVSVEMGDRSKAEVRDELNEALKDIEVDTHLTGAELILEDFIITTQEGIHKTEGIAVAFIIIVLILVFRSPVAPIVSLIAVAITYLASLGIVTILVDQVNFPFSNFTQIFLVLVLFGIGTDYNILLFTRFKEELTKQKTILEAIIYTYKTAGKTVLFSGLAVFIGFIVLGLAEFKLFKSASAVGIGVGVLLLALYTIVPIFMALLGNKLFWPSKNSSGHKENRLTSSITQFSARKPILGLIISLSLCVPFIFFYNGQLTYNSLDEIDDSYPSVKGISVVYDHFPPGQALPTTLVLKSDQPFDSNESLAFIDEVTESIQSIKGVDKVYSTTRPQGEKIPELYTNDQGEQVNEGVKKANDGVVTIKDGLTDAVHQIEAVPTEDFNKVNDLISGTKEIQSGINQSTDALIKIDNGLQQGVSGTDQLQQGIHSLNSGLTDLVQSTSALSSNVSSIQAGYNTLYSQYQKIEGSVNGFINASNAMNGYIAALEQTHGELKADKNFLALKQTSIQLNEQLKQLSAGLSELNKQFASANEKLGQINTGLKQINDGQGKILSGSKQLEASVGSLKDGLRQSSDGQKQVIAGLPKLSDGLTEINEGQAQLDSGLNELEENMSTLEKGLNDSVAGLGEVNNGLTDVNGYLDEVTKTKSTESFFIPEDVRTGEDFQKSIDAFMSDDRKLVKWTIVLSVDPYSNEAMDVIKEINQKYEQLVKDTDFEHDSYGIAGISSQNNDLNTVSTGDFTKTASIMLVGILIVLFVITRSFWTPVYIIASLILAYFTALSATEMLFKNFTSFNELTWTIPFFAFIMVVALGVDYSIFLMMRFREYKDMPVKEAILEAMKHTGGVIISAVIILSGTFAAMYPSGVLTLTQLATAVIIALLLLAFIFLPMFLPALMTMTNKRK
ncbi:MMPL family transporter [Bacillus sp. 03113]|uniref:MMPL family transporter n=1 Tax=Bacillus sp. 03113 TaxID=2578211 RepID=UPI0015E89CD0|nr:MMPL family transporter [Bacillus sp. 03113]